MSTQEVPNASLKQGDTPTETLSAQAVPAASPKTTGPQVKAEPRRTPTSSTSNGKESDGSLPAEICVVIGSPRNSQTQGSYVCRVCGKKYKYYNCFQTHVRAHRESESTVPTEATPHGPNNAFRYTCDICGKKYKYYSCFQEHRELHAVDDPYDHVIPVEEPKEEIEPYQKIGPSKKTGSYTCEFCGKQYKYFNPYQEHVALHTPMKSSFGLKIDGKTSVQPSRGDANSSQSSSDATSPMVASAFPASQTDNENHTKEDTAKACQAPAPSQEQTWKSPQPAQRNHVPSSYPACESQFGRKRREDLWTHFCYNQTERKTQCIVPDEDGVPCGYKLAGKNTTNLKRHLKTRHPTVSAKIPETRATQQKTGGEKEEQQITISNVHSLESKYHPDAKEQQIKERALALWIGRTGLPARTVEDEDFIKMMEVVDRNLAIPQKTKISNLIESIYQDERKKFKDRLATARKITIGLDMWTNKGLGASFLAISACYFCTVQNQPEHTLLGLERISRPHTADSVKACVDQCTEVWGIPENKILTVITDNGSNMVAEFRSEEEEPGSADSEEDERMEGEDEDEETRYGSIKERTPCFVHTLHLVVNMIHKDVSLTRLLEKVKTVVKQFHRSSVAMEKLHQLSGLTRIKNSATGWSSTFQMLSHLLQVKDSMVQVANEMGWHCLLPSEWVKMSAVRDLLLPFADHATTLQSDTMSLSLIVPVLLDLITHLSQFSLESCHRDLRSLANKLKVNLEQHFGCFLLPSEAKFSPLAAAACFLDPTVAGDALIENPDDGIQELLNEAEKFVYTLTTQGKDDLDKDDGAASMKKVEEEPSSKRPRFRFLSKSTSSKLPKPNKAQQEMRKYKEELSSLKISDFECGMDFWLAQNSVTYVTLKPLALDLLAMPASQAFAKRVFSITGDLMRARHDRARREVERSAFLKLNRDK
ncbi:zinc finger protein 618 isoform X3 [Neoarius graeffei]|uniref:zinc finger protein 618 isoform X3 n=1 Tax=Neoarius graeffei TaxID=443677 RepID=UPI00298D2717|nr:zinc finger protein 618 isoform X3 [Neoarius graeffei]